MDTQQDDKHRNQERRETESPFDEIPRGIGTHTAAGVRELMVLVQHLTVPRVFYHTLIGCSRREIRHEGQRQIEGHDNQTETDHEVQFLVLEDILNANDRGKA